MIVALWIAFGLLVVGFAALCLVLNGMVHVVDGLARELMELRESREYSPTVPAPVGSVAPAFEGRTVSGAQRSSDRVAGSPHLLVFAHSGCRSCEGFMPDLVRAASDGETPPTVVVSRPEPGSSEDRWTSPESDPDRIEVILDDDGSISDRFGVEVTPMALVVGADGRMAAGGVVNEMADVERLLSSDQE